MTTTQPSDHEVVKALQDPDTLSSNWVFENLRTAAFQALNQARRNGRDLTEDEFVSQVMSSPLAVEYIGSQPTHTEAALEARARRVFPWVEDHFDWGGNVQERLQDMVDWVFRQEWSPGKAGINERRACLAILDRCMELGAYSPNVSARWLASHLGMTDQTSGDTIRDRLVEKGFMTLVASSRRFGDQYRVNLERGAGGPSAFPSDSVTSTTNKLYRYNLFVVVRTDLELGPVPAWIHHFLPETTATEAAERLGVSRSSCERALKILVGKGLAEKHGKTYIRVKIHEPCSEIPNRFAEEQARNRAAVEDGYRNRQAKEANDRAELLASLVDQVGDTRTVQRKVLVSGDPFSEDAVYKTETETLTAELVDWLDPPCLVWRSQDGWWEWWGDDCESPTIAAAATAQDAS